METKVKLKSLAKNNKTTKKVRTKYLGLTLRSFANKKSFFLTFL